MAPKISNSSGNRATVSLKGQSGSAALILNWRRFGSIAAVARGRTTNPCHSNLLSVQRFERCQQLVGGGGDVADASAGCVMDGIDDRGARSADAELADALAAERTAVGIVLMHKQDVHLADVGVDRDVIARQILVDE